MSIDPKTPFLFMGVKDECHVLSYQVISAYEGQGL